MIPKHLAIIMDGNGRWAKAQGKPRTFGHKRGSEVLQEICKEAHLAGVKYLTVYAFSTENWKRSTEEVSFLMTLLRQYLKESIRNAKENNMRVRVIGRREDLEADIRKAIEEMEEATKDFSGLNLQIALNYGGRDELLRAIQKFSNHLLRKAEVSLTKEKVDFSTLYEEVQCIDEISFESYLDTHDIPDPELLIRTSGELRTSNFLPWQLAYTEFYFTPIYWPDFNKTELMKAFDYFGSRERRFGGLA